MKDELQINWASLTDVGRMRQANEDFMGQLDLPWGKLFVVCDGMGGHVGGARASSIATQSILEFFGREDGSDPVGSLNRALQFANEQIFATALNDPSLKGMGTTSVILLVKDSGIWLAHVGDSRIYIHSEGHLHRLTRDHSFVQGLVDQGIISDEDAEKHPRKNELLKALGIRSTVEVEVTPQPVFPQAGDRFLMCTDGLNGMIGDKLIEQIINDGGNLEDQAQRLIDAANEAAGADNITLHLIEVLQSPHKGSRFEPILPPVNMARTKPFEPQVFLNEEPTGGGMPRRTRVLIVAGVAILVLLFLILKKPGGVPSPGKDKPTIEKDTTKVSNQGSEEKSDTSANDTSGNKATGDNKPEVSHNAPSKDNKDKPK